MDRKRPVSKTVLVNIPQGTRQYWQGQWDALIYCARIIRAFANRNPTSKDLNRLARAIEIKARLTARNKLGENAEGVSREKI